MPKKHESKTVVKSEKIVAKIETPTLTVELPIAQARDVIAGIVANGGTFAESILPADIAAYAGEGLARMEGGLRETVLTMDCAIRTNVALVKSVQAVLYGKYSKSTIDNLTSAARNLVPVLREINCLGYRDPNGLRDLAVILRDKKHKAHDIVVAGIVADKSKSAIQAEVVAKFPDLAKGKTTRKPAGNANPVETGKADDDSHIDHIRSAVDVIAAHIGSVPLVGNHSVQAVFSARLKGYIVTIEKKSK